MKINVFKCWGTVSSCGTFCDVLVFADKEQARIKMREYFEADKAEYEDDFVEVYIDTLDRKEFHCGDDYYYYKVEEHEL